MNQKKFKRNTRYIQRKMSSEVTVDHTRCVRSYKHADKEEGLSAFYLPLISRFTLVTVACLISHSFQINTERQSRSYSLIGWGQCSWSPIHCRDYELITQNLPVPWDRNCSFFRCSCEKPVIYMPWTGHEISIHSSKTDIL